MKINIVLIVIGFFVLFVGVAQPVYADQWDYSNNPSRFQIQFSHGANEAAHLNTALRKFNKLLKAYSVNQDGAYAGVKGEVEVGAIAYNSARRLSNALEQFNLALEEAYPTLSEEEQSAVEEAYSSLGLYLEDLAEEANLVFGGEVFWIEYGEPISEASNSTSQGRFITIIDDLNSNL